MTGRVQRATLVGGFDDEGAQRQTTYNPITAGKIPAVRFRIKGELLDHRPLSVDRLIQTAMFRGIDHIDATAKHGNRPSTSLQGSLVRQAINTTRQAADYRETMLGQFCTQTLGRQLAIGAWLP